MKMSFAQKGANFWDCQDVCNWLQSMGMGRYASAFQQRNIVGKQLFDIALKPTQLADYGVSRIHQKKLSREILKLDFTGKKLAQAGGSPGPSQTSSYGQRSVRSTNPAGFGSLEQRAFSRLHGGSAQSGPSANRQSPAKRNYESGSLRRPQAQSRYGNSAPTAGPGAKRGSISSMAQSFQNVSVSQSSQQPQQNSMG